MRRWRFFTRENIELSRLDDGSVAELVRWRLVETPVGGVMVHQHRGPDPGRWLHDHPWSFVSVVLRGGYVEEVNDARYASACAQGAERWPNSCLPGVRRFRPFGSVRSVRLDQVHRIVLLTRTPTWTLVVHGPRRRAWGFYFPTGFIHERKAFE